MTGLEPLEGEPMMSAHAQEIAAFPEYYEQYFKEAMLGGSAVPITPAACTGEIAYVGTAELQRDLDNMTAAVAQTPPAGAFMPAVAPSGLCRNRYYATEEAFWEAAGEALRTEYEAIVDAGFILQIDDPFLTSFFTDESEDPAEQIRRADSYVEILNHSLRNIPEQSLRYHVCYSINEGPRIFDVPFIESCARCSRSMPWPIPSRPATRATNTSTTCGRRSGSPTARSSSRA